MGNKLGVSPKLSESLTSEDVEEIYAGTGGNGNKEDMDSYHTVTSSMTKSILDLVKKM